METETDQGHYSFIQQFQVDLYRTTMDGIKLGCDFQIKYTTCKIKSNWKSGTVRNMMMNGMIKYRVNIGFSKNRHNASLFKKNDRPDHEKIKSLAER